MNFKEYIIKKGKHRSGIYLALHNGCQHLHYQVVFERDCVYHIDGEDKFDINKLFGVSFGLHHKNSARFGWRCTDDEKIEIYAYCYVKGKRVYESIATINIGVIYNFKLCITDDQYMFKIYHLDTLINTVKIPKGKTIKFGYYLFPYFGGNQVAPHKMSILLAKLTTKSLKMFY